jgi:hypothetical protein
MISNSYFPAIAAIELGFFRQEGLDVELDLIFPVDKAYAALREGAVDLVGGSAHSALAAFPQWRGVSAGRCSLRPDRRAAVVRDADTFLCRLGRRAGTHTLCPLDGARRMGPCFRRDDSWLDADEASNAGYLS